MRVVVQRVDSAQVSVDQKIVGTINKGLLIFLGIGNGDTKLQADRLIKKIVSLRIFERESRLDQSVTDLDLELLIVSQFTLYADTKKGNRPSFLDAAKPQSAQELYEYFLESAKTVRGESRVFSGVFGAEMKISLVNNGPFTLTLKD